MTSYKSSAPSVASVFNSAAPHLSRRNRVYFDAGGI